MQAALHHRLESGQSFGGGVAQTLVAADRVPLGRGLLVLADDRRLQWRDFPVEAMLVPCALGLLLGDQAEVVEVGAGEATATSDPLRGGELVGHVDVPRLGADPGAIRPGVGTQAHPAHRLDAAGDPDVDGPGGDQTGDQVVGLLGAAALAVDGGRAGLLGQPGGQPGHPGDVVGLLAELGDAPADDLFDLAGIDPGLVHEGLLHRPEQLGGVQSGEPPVAFADRAAGGLDDHGSAHAARLEHVSVS